MRLTPIALLMMAALTGAAGPSSTNPESRDITIRTRTTFGGNRGIWHSAVLQVKGARQRLVRTWQDSSATHAGPGAVITQCDTRRVVFVNDAKRLYGISPFLDGGPIRAAEIGWTTSDTRPVTETMTIDAVDTGERRAFGVLTARHVVTTTTTERRGDGPIATHVQDGWYLDLPSEKCEAERGAGYAMLVSGSSSGRTEVKWKGTAKTGWPVMVTNRTTGAGGALFGSTTSLVEFSEAPLDPALFDVPPGYRPALPLGHGGFDLEKPDTVVNRVRHAVESVASWVHYTWSQIGSRSDSKTIARRR